MRHRPLRALLALLLAAGLLAACGNDDDAPTTPSGDTTAPADGNGDSNGDTDSNGDDGAWPPGDSAGSGAAGTVTIDGTTYTIDAVRECDVTDFFDGDDRERTFMMQGIGLVDPDDEWSDEVVVTVYEGITTNPDRDMQGIGWNGPEGLYDGLATGNDVWTVVSDMIDGPPLEFGDRITGELNLRSNLGNPPVDATVDLEAPATGPVDC